MNCTTIFVLLVAYQLKHFLADFPLQGKYMLGKFKTGWDFLGPLSAHCGVHALFTHIIASVFLFCTHGPGYGLLPFQLALTDFVVHFLMDRIKASPRCLGRYKALSGAEFVEIGKQQRTLFSDVLDKGTFVADCLKNEQITKRLRDNTYFWWALGLDQMIHHLTHYYIIWRLLDACSN